MPQPRKLHDRFFKQAKAEGYLARSAYKLIEINDRRKVLAPGQAVLDLGCAPGSWLQVAGPIIGAKGTAVGIDLQPVTHAFGPNVRTIVADVFKVDPAALLALSARPFDVVLSDMAPSTTGNRLTDQARSHDLFMRALAVAEALLKPGGHFVGKIFMGEDFPAARAEVRKLFDSERLIRPEGTRQVSYEIFVLGLGRKPH